MFCAFAGKQKVKKKKTENSVPSLKNKIPTTYVRFNQKVLFQTFYTRYKVKLYPSAHIVLFLV